MLFNVSNLALGLKSSLFNSSKFFNNASSKTFSAFSFSPLLFLLFYEIYDSVNKVIDVFQCPTSGFLLFYFHSAIDYENADMKFQCPTSGFLLFYSDEDLRNFLAPFGVSMPYLGLSSFLLTMMGKCHSKRDRCFNALPRAFFFSTDIPKHTAKTA